MDFILYIAIPLPSLIMVVQTALPTICRHAPNFLLKINIHLNGDRVFAHHTGVVIDLIAQ